MRILDSNNVELVSPDLTLGKLVEDKFFVMHHEAVEPVEEQFHYEYKNYPNGGRDRIRVIDVEAVTGAEAWDEYEDILRYVPYTDEELEEMNKPSQLDVIEAQVTYTAMMTDTLLEV